jgi:nitroreductase
MLAARARGLGTVLTTAHLRYERDVADALGIPYDSYTQVGLIPIGFFTGTTFRPAPRVEMSTITHFDKW